MSLPAIDLFLHGYAIFLRGSAFLFLLPFVGRPVPVLIRAAAGVYLAVFLVPVTTPATSLQMPAHIPDLVVISIREIMIGFIMGYAVQMVFYLCSVSGRLLSMEIGLMQSNLFNTMTSEQSTVLSTAMTSLAIVLIFTLEIHHSILSAFVRSFDLLPAGTAAIGAGSADDVIRGVGNIFLLAVQISAPLIAVNFIVTLSFAILGRAVPNLNILVLSFGARILAGFFVLIIVFVVVVQFLLGHINGTPERILQFLPLP